MGFDYVKFMDEYKYHVFEVYGTDPLEWPWIDREKTEETGVKHAKAGYASRRSLMAMRLGRETSTEPTAGPILKQTN